MCLGPLLLIVFRLHLRHSGLRPFEGEEFLVAGEDARVHGALVGRLDAKVVDEHPVFLETLLLADLVRSEAVNS